MPTRLRSSAVSASRLPRIAHRAPSGGHALPVTAIPAAYDGPPAAGEGSIADPDRAGRLIRALNRSRPQRSSIHTAGHRLQGFVQGGRGSCADRMEAHRRNAAEGPDSLAGWHQPAGRAVTEPAAHHPYPAAPSPGRLRPLPGPWKRARELPRRARRRAQPGRASATRRSPAPPAARRRPPPAAASPAASRRSRADRKSVV